MGDGNGRRHPDRIIQAVHDLLPAPSDGPRRKNSPQIMHLEMGNP
jgi:hypothetical protein